MGRGVYKRDIALFSASGVLTFKWVTFLVLIDTWYFNFYFTCLAGCLRVHVCTMCMPHGLLRPDEGVASLELELTEVVEARNW